jgi:hypothetical protein
MRTSRTILFAAAGMIFAGSAAQACDWMHTASAPGAEQKVAMSEAPSPALSLVDRNASAAAECVGDKCSSSTDRGATKSSVSR